MPKHPIGLLISLAKFELFGRTFCHTGKHSLVVIVVVVFSDITSNIYLFSMLFSLLGKNTMLLYVAKISSYCWSKPETTFRAGSNI
jgi:hypothetical protein